MDGEILDAVTEWETRSVTEGVSGLYDLADEEFSGAVTDGSAWAFVLNGRYLGVFGGDIDDFADASLTAHTAPDIALPLLYAMQARGGRTRARYYSNETPLTDIDETLSTGTFVGYVELSENVLSGDYYVVYYGERAFPVAYVGNSRRLLTGDEAFERAADEVGIYSVVDADIDVVDLPDRPDPRDETGSGAGAGAGAAVTPGTGDPETDITATNEDDVAFDDTDPRATDDGGVGTDAADGDAPDDAFAAPSSDRPPDEDADGGGDPASDATETPPDAESSTPDWTTPDVVADDDPDEVSDAITETSDAAATADDAGDDAGTTVAPGSERADADGSMSAAEPGAVTTEDVAVDPAGDADAAGTVDTEDTETAGESTESTAADADEVARLRSELDAARAAKSEAESARDEYRATVERLRTRVEELEAELERLRTDGDATEAATERTLSPAEALSGTNLFVRYEDKTEGTLERAAAGRIDESTLRSNLRIEYHTEFETTGLTVDGEPFGTFLRGSAEHRFAEWLLTALTYEIRRTDARVGLSKLYEAIEQVDRVDLDGTVDVATGERGESTTESFDVVFRNKMGDPLFVAAFDEGRDPTTAPTVESLIDPARRVSDAEETLAAAFFISTSFFGADAMKAAVDATRGGLFSRSSRRSYVKLSRKSGFHLCLVEARDEDFSLTVPDL
jgi:hypothetical protein